MRKKKNARANKVRYGRQESMKRKRDIKKEKIGTTPINDFSFFIYLFICFYFFEHAIHSFRDFEIRVAWNYTFFDAISPQLLARSSHFM